MVDSSALKKEAPRFLKKTFTAHRKGLFVPLRRPLSEIRKGEVVGVIHSGDGKFTNQVSTLDGVLMQTRRSSAVEIGEDVFAIGVENECKTK